MFQFIKRDRYTAAGFLIILTGLSLKWLTSGLFAEDGRIDDPLTNAVVTSFSALFVVAGGGLIIRDREKLRGDLVNLGVFTAATALCFLALELFLRAYPFALATSSTLKLPVWRENPHGTGSFRLSENVSITARMGRRTITIRTNSFGMPGNEVSVAKPASKRRVVFLGDSYAFGCWADDWQHSFVGVFEALLDTQRYEVLNFAVPGYGPADVLLQLQEDVLPFAPDVAVLMFYNGNDFADAYLGTERWQVVDGMIELRRPPAPPPATRRGGARAFVERLAVFRSVHWLYSRTVQVIRAMTYSPLNEPPVFRVDSLSSNLLGEALCRRRYPPAQARAIDTTLVYLSRIRTLCRENGAQLVIAAIPFIEQVYVCEPVGENYSVDYPQAHLRTYAADHSVPFLDLLPPLRNRALREGSELYWNTEGHLNNEGHRLVGQALAAFFHRRFDPEVMTRP